MPLQYGAGSQEDSWRALGLQSTLRKTEANRGPGVLMASSEPNVHPLLKPGLPLRTFPHAPLDPSHFLWSFLSLRTKADINIYKAFSILNFSED